ncbi:MAG: hypothetical protein K2J20_01635 [Bacilli bacterium]|nr:hypothetical protein [Bacilli bacterium]
MKERQNDNIIFLNLIYQNAQMGLIGIDAVIDKVEDERVAKLIKEQRAEYEEFCEQAKEILIKYGAQEEEIGKLQKLSSKIMSEAMTFNKDDKNIVKLMMEGNEKGVIAIKEKLNAYEDKDPEIVALAEKLLATEEHNREEFKQYL